ncbi:BRCA1 BRCA2-containing complex, subunit 3 [Cichlidogyrus casuarinus]|uniref:BRCA1 BRCA2-containing complex, subunit 3 n=1 Tax=Cichlidogyrus casuarinus TaxID=1844966 RepID=A0ABD2PWG1_9PLAT
MDNSQIRQVKVNSVAYKTICTHAYTSENEEIAGLLAGEVSSDRNWHIKLAIPLARLFKAKDRVEISDNQLIETMQMVQTEGLKMNMPKLRIVGWYHSHPHISVWPSHVDLQTQATYQLMDRDFIGLIVSVFSRTQNSDIPEISELCAFQDDKRAGVYYTVEILEDFNNTINGFNQLNTIPRLLLQEANTDLPISDNSVDKDQYPISQGSQVLNKVDDDFVIREYDALYKMLSKNYVSGCVLLPMRNIYQKWVLSLRDQVENLKLRLEQTN